MKWWLWRILLKRTAARHGFLDPFALQARLQRFAQPSEVSEPVELLRAGALLHARGLMNSRVIQSNLDWVWPYWVCRQFDATDPAFIPRAFNITHINLTHRNWVAIGLPDLSELPIVDPRGLVTPFLDSWSIDAWIVAPPCTPLTPSREQNAAQRLDLSTGIAVVTESESDDQRLTVTANVEMVDDAPCCRISCEGESGVPGWLVITLRPYNPEGISLIDSIALSSNRQRWTINGEPDVVRFDASVDHHQVSHYRHGDVTTRLVEHDAERLSVECEAGMATAAACFALDGETRRRVDALVPLTSGKTRGKPAMLRSPKRHVSTWDAALNGRCQLDIPDEGIKSLYEAAMRTLVLLSPDDVYPGPFTYRRFWYRDAAYMIHALLCAGLTERARRALDRFPERQTVLGYFHSQDGEWDSNGQSLWIMRRYCELTGEPPPASWREPIMRGARWIARKRLPKRGKAHDGLLPAGFSAEHFGPNDFYYWDDFWSIAGLDSAADLAHAYGDHAAATEFEEEAADLRATVDACLEAQAQRNGRPAMPASPYRRLDAGAIGCLAAGYPLKLVKGDDPRLIDTAEFLLTGYCREDGFFHDIVHSGINAYLTMHLSQVLMRAGDGRFSYLLESVAKLATPTGQWPEAVHPHTKGGCMGDGQHGWAAAEWLMLIRECFVSEEGDRLVIGAGIDGRWLYGGRSVSFGPAPTRFGPVTVEFRLDGKTLEAKWDASWRQPPAAIDVSLPGHERVSVDPSCNQVEMPFWHTQCKEN